MLEPKNKIMFNNYDENIFTHYLLNINIELMNQFDRYMLTHQLTHNIPSKTPFTMTKISDEDLNLISDQKQFISKQFCIFEKNDFNFSKNNFQDYQIKYKNVLSNHCLKQLKNMKK